MPKRELNLILEQIDTVHISLFVEWFRVPGCKTFQNFCYYSKQDERSWVEVGWKTAIPTPSIKINIQICSSYQIF